MPAPPSSPQTFDTSVLDELERAIGKDGLGRVLRAFVEELADFEAQLRSLEGSDDFDTLSRLGHTLKSTAGTFGATSLSSNANTLDLAARAKDLSGTHKHRLSVLEDLSVARDHFNQLTD